ncbi:MAG UNVERIFIED_CONTAM: hypothetical protein LVQ98_09460 [Rickettsiaceae bacterium]|jgi:hypothetical protein
MSYQALLETLKVTRFFTEDDLTTALQELTVPDAADPVVVLGDDMGQT